MIRNIRCDNCSNIFGKRNSFIEKSAHNFCSRKCFYDWRKKNRIPVICLICSKEFYVSPSRVKNNRRKYCSDICRRKAFSTLCKSLAKDNSPHWKGGATSINKKMRIVFHNTIQKKVFERDNYTCQMCGTRGGYLQVDHIQEWSKYVEGRFDINNCRTLCQKCHYFVTFGREMPKRVKIWGNNLSYPNFVSKNKGSVVAPLREDRMGVN